MKIGVLDQSPISEGSTGADALRNTLDLAQLADGLGYERYWVAEHHGTPMLACASPEVMIAAMGSYAPRRIRIGSGGVMLPHYSPLKVAETFSILSALFPGRVDLGIGRAPGTDHTTAFALQRDRRQPAPDDFPQQLGELLGYLENSLPPGHPSRGWRRCRDGRTFPRCGCWDRPCRAPCGPPITDCRMCSPISSIPRAPAMRRCIANGSRHRCRWRSRESSSPGGPSARRPMRRRSAIASSARMTRALLNEGKLIPVPPIEKAERFLAERGPRADTIARPRRAIIGDPAAVKTGIEELATLYGADEVMIVSITYEHAARRRSYELIAEVFGLS